MVYTPQKHPKAAFVTISIIVFFGVIGSWITRLVTNLTGLDGGLYKLFPLVAFFYWIQYTIILAYLQFMHKSKHGSRSFTDIMLNPILRFFIFLLLSFWGIYHVFLGQILISYIILIGWWGFSLNFYLYYKNKNWK
ncbi:MAG: hypothetical protein KJ601_06980 [Nanoarchaeota archaeon]|nr:hypothetical protein [Nanoarchaeota archaeon]MBU1704921.1 hypothetical protein [Nanoarchaeota archaeon]